LFNAFSGKIWGRGPRTILAVHGWLDNCNSFSPIAPLLPLDDFRVIALDMPGHGLSDHHAPGMVYSVTDGLVIIKKTQVNIPDMIRLW
jgi:pimeloyl-ACP methyl ester carboxylesterase